MVLFGRADLCFLDLAESLGLNYAFDLSLGVLLGFGIYDHAWFGDG